MMKRISTLVLFFLFLNTAVAEVSIYMTHVQKEYDSEDKLSLGIDHLLSTVKNPQIIVLQNNLTHWQTKLNGSEIVNFSQYGEHQVKPQYSTVLLLGAQLGACLQFTIRDLIKMQKGKALEILIDSKTVLSIEGELLSEKLAQLQTKEAEHLLHRYFSRTLFTDNNSWVRKAKINISYKKKLLGSLKDNAIKKPYKKPTLTIGID